MPNVGIGEKQVSSQHYVCLVLIIINIFRVVKTSTHASESGVGVLNSSAVNGVGSGRYGNGVLRAGDVELCRAECKTGW